MSAIVPGAWVPGERDCKPEPKPQGINRPSDREFGGGGEQRGSEGIAGLQGRGQCRLGFRQALAAAGADAKIARQVAQAARATLDGDPNLSVRHRFADANYHERIVNANANDCQYRIHQQYDSTR